MGPSHPVNPYQPPRAELDVPRTTALPATIEDAIAGRYDCRVGEVMSEAWELTKGKGMKASFWGAAIVIGVAVVGVMHCAAWP